MLATQVHPITSTQAVRPTKSEIFTVYNKLRAMARRHPHLWSEQRVNKALGILQSKAYYQGERAGYMPTVDWCDCKDWEFRFAKRRKHTGPCKHMLAELMLAEIAKLRSEHDVTVLVGMHEAREVLESSYRA